MGDFAELRARRRAHTLGRRIGGDQRRMCFLQLDQFIVQPVILGVRDLRLVLDIVQPVVPLDFRLQEFVAFFCLGRGFRTHGMQ